MVPASTWHLVARRQTNLIPFPKEKGMPLNDLHDEYIQSLIATNPRAAQMLHEKHEKQLDEERQLHELDVEYRNATRPTGGVMPDPISGIGFGFQHKKSPLKPIFHNAWHRNKYFGNKWSVPD